MSGYEDYCTAIQLVADGPGTRDRELEAITAEKQTALDAALRRDREVQARWIESDRVSRDLGIRIRKLADFVGAALPRAEAPAQTWELARIETELAGMTKDVQQLESAMDWIGRARRQVSAERGKLG